MPKSSGRPALVRGLRWAGIALLGLVTLHSFAYGAAFLFDPINGVEEFGQVADPSEAALNLTRIVGLLLLLMALTAAVGAGLGIQGHPGAAWIQAALGTTHATVGLLWGALGRAWDFGFYTLLGVMLLGAAAGGLWPASRDTRPPQPPTAPKA